MHLLFSSIGLDNSLFILVSSSSIASGVSTCSLLFSFLLSCLILDGLFVFVLIKGSVESWDDQPEFVRFQLPEGLFSWLGSYIYLYSAIIYFIVIYSF
jgi:hypothetical protein